MKHSLQTYREEVIEMVCDLEGCSEECAARIVEEKSVDIEYGHKHRISPHIVAGSILGINDCCFSHSAL
ncbi:MAG: hypothetical protein AB7S65_06745 [Sulfuricurvum sp.]